MTHRGRMVGAPTRRDRPQGARDRRGDPEPRLTPPGRPPRNESVTTGASSGAHRPVSRLLVGPVGATGARDGAGRMGGGSGTRAATAAAAPDGRRGAARRLRGRSRAAWTSGAATPSAAGATPSRHGVERVDPGRGGPARRRHRAETAPPTPSPTPTATPSESATPSPSRPPNERSPHPHPSATTKPRTSLIRGDSRPQGARPATAPQGARLLARCPRRLVRVAHPAGRVGVPEVRGPQARRRRRAEDAPGALEAGIRPKATIGGNGVEIDLDRQILLVVRGGSVRTILNTSTGSGEEYTSTSGNRAIAVTPRGSYTVYRCRDGPRHELARTARAAALLPPRHRRARFGQHPAVARLARLRAAQQRRHRPDLGDRPDAGRQPRRGALSPSHTLVQTPGGPAESRTDFFIKWSQGVSGRTHSGHDGCSRGARCGTARTVVPPRATVARCTTEPPPPLAVRGARGRGAHGRAGGHRSGRAP